MNFFLGGEEFHPGAIFDFNQMSDGMGDESPIFAFFGIVELVNFTPIGV